MITKFLDPKNDRAFKRIFGSERNKDILIHFLNDIFERTANPIEDVTFLKNAQDPEISSQRESIVDVLCRDFAGNHFIVEMQVDSEPGFEKRAQFYASKTYIQQRERGVEYKDLKEVTFLAITSHVLFPTKEAYLSHHRIQDIKTQEQDLKDFSFCFLELPKFRKAKDDLNNMIEKWAHFFKSAPETSQGDLTNIIGDDRIMERAYHELDRYSWTEEEIRTYDGVDMKRSSEKAIREKLVNKGKAEGRVEGRAEGEIKKSKEIALVMIKAGESLDRISLFTGLSLLELQNIRTLKDEKKTK